MEIEQSFNLPYPAAEVWKSFKNVEEIVSCLPGAALLAPPEASALTISMTVKLGPIVAAFAGDGEIFYDDETYSGKITGSGADRKSGSRVKGEARFNLIQRSDLLESFSTEVTVTVDYTITGPLAQFSRGGIVKDIAQRLTQAFADNLKLKIQTQQQANTVLPTELAKETGEPSQPLAAANIQDSTPLHSTPLHSAPQPAAPEHAPVAPLDLGNLFWQSLWKRIKKAFGFSRT